MPSLAEGPGVKRRSRSPLRAAKSHRVVTETWKLSVLEMLGTDMAVILDERAQEKKPQGFETLGPGWTLPEPDVR